MSDNTTPEAKTVDYGPLALLMGVWKGDRGMDIAPEPDGVEKSPYFETITFAAAGDVTNAEEQLLAVVRYHQVVSRKSNNEVFHDQVGYWLWDAATGVVMQTLTIPRGVCVTATGKATPAGQGGWRLQVAASKNDSCATIAESPFMATKAGTVSYVCEFVIEGDNLAYNETTLVDIYGKKAFEHTDRNKLVRAAN